jgi:hypothetical protein
VVNFIMWLTNYLDVNGFTVASAIAIGLSAGFFICMLLMLAGII